MTEEDRSDRCGGYDARRFVAEYYDHVPLYANRRDVPFYAELAAQAGGPVLELGCGTGRLLVPLIRSGFAVDGIDLSSAMLERCERKLAAEPASVQARASIRQADMTDFDLGKQYPLVIAPFRCFQHLIDVDDQMRCLRSAARHLAPGGLLVLDLFNTDPARMHDPKYLDETVEFEDLELLDGRRLGRSSRTVAFHPARQYNDTELIYHVEHPDGRAERLVHAFPIRLFFRYEVEHVLARCGFALTACYGDYDRSPYQDDSPEMIVLAEKI